MRRKEARPAPQPLSDADHFAVLELYYKSGWCAESIADCLKLAIEDVEYAIHSYDEAKK